jgi:DNA-binding MarR family transcriptional regulator
VKDLQQQLMKYLDELGLSAVRLQPMPQAERELPVFIGQSYDFRAVHLFGKPYALCIRKPGEQPTPAEAMKQAQVVKEKLGYDVLLVIEDLKPFERKRWVEKGIPFVVPGRHFHCPMFLIDFRDMAKRAGYAPSQKPEAISASTQALFIYYLLNDVGARNIAEWAEILHYTRMTISRARKDLEAANLCEAVDDGRSVLLRFPNDKRGLWERALPFLRDPVVRRRHVDLVERNGIAILAAGISALSLHSMLSDDQECTYAMSSAAFKAGVEGGKIAEYPGRIEGSVLVEQWRYAPALLSANRESVDPLSLYLSLRESPDERVQGALNEMQEALQW